MGRDESTLDLFDGFQPVSEIDFFLPSPGPSKTTSLIEVITDGATTWSSATELSTESKLFWLLERLLLTGLEVGDDSARLGTVPRLVSEAVPTKTCPPDPSRTEGPISPKTG
jgi:hypothetical protein